MFGGVGSRRNDRRAGRDRHEGRIAAFVGGPSRSSARSGPRRSCALRKRGGAAVNWLEWIVLAAALLGVCSLWDVVIGGGGNVREQDEGSPQFPRQMRFANACRSA